MEQRWNRFNCNLNFLITNLHVTQIIYCNRIKYRINSSIWISIWKSKRIFVRNSPTVSPDCEFLRNYEGGTFKFSSHPAECFTCNCRYSNFPDGKPGMDLVKLVARTGAGITISRAGTTSLMYGLIAETLS